jgi:acyl carrier protein
MNNLELKLQEIMSAVFEVTLQDVSLESNQDNVEGWDSLKHLDLVVSLEEEFDVLFPVEEIGELVSFRIISASLDELL